MLFRDADTSSHSVTRLIEQMKSDDGQLLELAATEIWNRFARQLRAVARRTLTQHLRTRADADDILQSVYGSFFRRHREGRFQIHDRNDLWGVLLMMTLNKARNTAKHHHRQKRDCRLETCQSKATTDDSGRRSIELMPSDQLGPDDLAAIKETLDRRLAQLDEPMRAIALQKLAGYSNQEIADSPHMKCSVRKIERKLAMIRQAWSEQ